MGYYRALAIDYDGTLTEGQRPNDSVLQALAAARRDGLQIVLVTGRILSNLREEFPDLNDHFDAIVAENGAVVSRCAGQERALAEPLSQEFSRALEQKGIPFHRGRVLLASSAEHAGAVELEVERLGLDYHLARNRAALMILPPAVSKGAGLCEALAELGISPHSAVAVGDAENDHSLIDVCELGVAVGNAVEGLKAHADVVLREANGAAIRSFAAGPVLSGAVRVHPRRWDVLLGTFEGGEAATVPASQANLLVTGDTGAGKSYVAGLLAERLISLGYSVCVIDPEGEHDALGRLRGAASVGGDETLPEPEQLRRLVLHRFGSLVVDLSSLSVGLKIEYLGKAFEALRRERAATGLPHWIVVDEAQLPLEAGIDLRAELAAGGLCIVTYRPERVPEEILRQTDVLLALRDEPARISQVLRALGPAFDARLSEPLVWGVGALSRRALLVTRHGGLPRAFTTSPRVSAHVRHWHKYMHATLEPHRWFLFRGCWGLTGRSAANLAEFHDELQRAGPDVIGHHVAGGDFSRWIETVVKDDELARGFSAVEGAAKGASDPTRAVVEEWRRELIRAIEERYR